MRRPAESPMFGDSARASSENAMIVVCIVAYACGPALYRHANVCGALCVRLCVLEEMAVFDSYFA